MTSSFLQQTQSGGGCWWGLLGGQLVPGKKGRKLRKKEFESSGTQQLCSKDLAEQCEAKEPLWLLVLLDKSCGRFDINYL